MTSMALAPQQITAVEAGVRKALKDPESARFGTIVAGRSPSGTIVVCGKINAKNSFGGYTGEKPFLGWLGPSGAFNVEGLGGEDFETVAILQVCNKQGLFP